VYPVIPQVRVAGGNCGGPQFAGLFRIFQDGQYASRECQRIICGDGQSTISDYALTVADIACDTGYTGHDALQQLE
jgi:hypothetical protein